ncbi:hypothetical protein ACQPYK_07015 [Streptosporangium sp. CA-135522]
MAIVVVALLQALFVYPFVWRHFTKGVIIGAIKGEHARGGGRPAGLRA